VVVSKRTLDGRLLYGADGVVGPGRAGTFGGDDQLHQIWLAESRVDAEQAFDHFLATYEAKYPKATECLAKDRATLLTFYDFPAEHWLHIRTTNPIESTFATVRLRTTKTRGCVSRAGILAMVFKLTKTAEQNWRTLKGHALLA
jgi:transposase-like protein